MRQTCQGCTRACYGSPDNIGPMSIEYEVKLEGSRESLVEALERIGARPGGPRTLEDDLVLDTPEGRLADAGQLLRLRRRAETYLLTFKGPQQEDASVKARLELQTPLADGVAMLGLLLELGFEIAVRYQKYRTEYRCRGDDWRDLVLTLDETPIGDFVEVEGDPARIEDCAEALGFDASSFETRSYLEIHRDRGGRGDMVFDGPESAPWLES